MMRAAALRNMNPAQMAAAAAASGSNPTNANIPNAMGMSGGTMVQRQAQQVNMIMTFFFADSTTCLEI